MKYKLKFPENTYKEILSLLRFKNEQAGFILAGWMKRSGSITLLAKKLLLCSSDGLRGNSPGHVEIKKDFAKRVLTVCKAKKLCLIHFHTHPFSSKGTRFSCIDDSCDEKFFSYVAEKIPGIYHAALVVGQKHLDGRIYERNLATSLPVSEISVIGDKLEKIIPNSSRKVTKMRGCESTIFQRQIRFLGKVGQRRLRSLSCAIVGLGGTGSLIFEGLLRLGVGKLILIDSDRIEVSNLNRIIQAFWEDVNSKRFKVDIMKRKAGKINPKTKIIALPRSLLTKSAQSLLKGVDVIFGTVDNDLARLVLNQLAAKYLIPLVDVATGINVDKKGKIVDFAGQVYVFIPGKSPCLSCLEAIDLKEVNLSLMSGEDRIRQRQLGYISGENIVAPAVLPLNMQLVSLALAEFMNLVFGFRKLNNYVFYDGLSQDRVAYTIKVKSESSCPICSPEGLLAKGDLARFEDLFRIRASKNIPTTRTSISKREITNNNNKGGTNG